MRTCAHSPPDRPWQRLSEGRIRDENGAVPPTDRAVMHAFERLMHEAAQVTDGAVTVVNICAEAGLSRATYYRSPVAGCIAGILRARDEAAAR